MISLGFPKHFAAGAKNLIGYQNFVASEVMFLIFSDATSLRALKVEDSVLNFWEAKIINLFQFGIQS